MLRNSFVINISTLGSYGNMALDNRKIIKNTFTLYFANLCLFNCIVLFVLNSQLPLL